MGVAEVAGLDVQAQARTTCGDRNPAVGDAGTVGRVVVLADVGLSQPRAAMKSWLDGRAEVTPQDLHAVFGPVIAHRIFFTPVYEMRRSEIAAQLTARILATVASP